MVDHSSINRWAIRLLSLLEKVFRNHKHEVGKSWRMDETYLKVKGTWKYLCCAADKQGKTVDFLLTAKRDASAAGRFFDKAMRYSEVPGTVTMDKSSAYKAALDQLDTQREIPIKWSRTIVPSNASPDRCSAPSRFGLRKQSWGASNPCT